VIALLSQEGRHEGLDSIHFRDAGPPVPTAALEHAAGLREILAGFRTNVLHARLSRLMAGRSIQRHRDYAYFGEQRFSFERGFIRVHAPIATDEHVTFRLQDGVLDMRPGEMWYVNVCLPHAVDNRSSHDRIHLVVELEVNDWVRSLFPPETAWGKLRGEALRRFEKPLWRLARPLLARWRILSRDRASAPTPS